MYNSFVSNFNHFRATAADWSKISSTPKAIPSARHQKTLQDHAYGLVYHATCLFTLQLSLATHSATPPTDGVLRLSRNECLVPRRSGLPVRRRSLIQALTGSSVE